MTADLVATLGVEHRREFVLDVELEIQAGTTVALLGPNGAGKSTAVAALAGLIPLDSGRIAIGDRVLDDPASGVFVPTEDRRMGVVFQDYLLFDHMNVGENVMFGQLAAGRSKAEAKARTHEWLDRLDLADLATRRPKALSGGQAQRVALARALATKPDLLLLDEPLAALDVGTRSELRRVLAQHLREFQGPRLLITHDPTDAFLLADRVVIIEQGQVTQAGKPELIRSRPATTYAAAVAGTNLLMGENDKGALRLTDYGHELQTSDRSVSGAVLIMIHPTAIALHAEQPHGSPRNSWQTSVATVEPLGDTTRITLGDPLPLGVDITPAATRALALVPGSQVWASIKATEIEVVASN